MQQLPRNSHDLNLSYLQQLFSPNLAAFQIAPLMVEVTKGIVRQDGGGASGSTLIRLHLQWKTKTEAPPIGYFAGAPPAPPALAAPPVGHFAGAPPAPSTKNHHPTCQPASVICKMTSLEDMPERPFVLRLLEWLLNFCWIRILYNEYHFFAHVAPRCRTALLQLPHTYVAKEAPPQPSPAPFWSILFDYRPCYRTLTIIEDFPQLKSGFTR